MGLFDFLKPKQEVKAVQKTEPEKADVKDLNKAGYYQGKHYTEYIDTVKELEQNNQYDEAIELLRNLVLATEAESKTEQRGVAPAYYEKLAIIYRKQNIKEDEINILERFAKQQHAPGVKPSKLLDRLEKLKS